MLALMTSCSDQFPVEMLLVFGEKYSTAGRGLADVRVFIVETEGGDWRDRQIHLPLCSLITLLEKNNPDLISKTKLTDCLFIQT